MIIDVKNNLTTNAKKSFLSAALTAGTTNISVKNHNSFTDGWAVQFGETGEERSEIKVINSTPSAGTFGLSAGLTYDHPADTPVYAIRFDQVIFKRSTDGTAGTATAMTDGTVNITPDSNHTFFDDTTGSTSYAYKASFYSTGLAAESSDSDWLAPAGYDFYSLIKIRERVKSKAPNSNSLRDDEIDDWVNEWMEELTNTAIDVNEDYAIGTTEVAFSGTNQYGTITASDFKQVRSAWYTENGSDYYRMTKQQLVDFSPSEVYNETKPFYFMRGETEIGRNPHNNAGTISPLTYYKLNAVLADDTDTLPQSMRGYTRSFVQYALAQAYRKENDQKSINQAERLETKAEIAREKFKNELTPRSKSGPTYMKIVEEFPESSYNEAIWW